jgi:hypothetical protein
MPEAQPGSETLDFNLTAIGSGREIRPGAIGAPALFLCFGQETQAGRDAVEAVARGKYATPAELVVVYLIDLHKIPGLLRKVAEGVLGNEHKKAVESVPPGGDPAEYVIVLPDWKGSAVQALGLEDATRTLGLALVDEGGRVTWRYQGAEPAAALEAWLAEQPL